MSVNISLTNTNQFNIRYIYNDIVVVEKKNKKRSLNWEEKQESMETTKKIATAVGTAYSTVTCGRSAPSSNKRQTSSSSSMLPPTDQVIRHESASKKMREDKTLEAMQLRELIMNARARIDTLSDKILEAIISKNEELEKNLENPNATKLEELNKKQEKERAKLKENEEKLAKLEDVIKQLSPPLCMFSYIPIKKQKLIVSIQ